MGVGVCGVQGSSATITASWFRRWNQQSRTGDTSLRKQELPRTKDCQSFGSGSVALGM